MARARTYRPLGCEFVVDPAWPFLVAAIREGIGRYGTTAGAGGRVRLRTTVHEDTADDPAWPAVTVHTNGTESLTVQCGSAVMEIDATAGTADLALPESLARVPDAVRMFVETSLTAHLVGTRRMSALHSALVVTGRRGLLLRGTSGAGKSTLSYACLVAGMTLCSDDWVYAVGDPSRLWGYPWRMSLLPDTVQFFPELAGVTPVPHPSIDCWKLPIQPPVRRRAVSAAVDAVVFVEPGDDLRVDAIGQDEAIERWWASALPTERRDVPVALVESLTDRPCLVLQRGADPAAAAQLLARTARDL